MSIIEALEPRVCLAISFVNGPSLPVANSFADINGDGILDMLGGNGSRVDIYAGLRPMQFAADSFRQLVAGHGGPFATGDLDHDGDVDVVIANDEGTYMGAAVFRNLGDGTFAERTFNYNGPHATDIAIDDLDRDGNLDLLVMHDQLWPASYGATYGVGVLFGDGDATFEPVRKVQLPAKPQVMRLPIYTFRAAHIRSAPRVVFGSNIRTGTIERTEISVLDFPNGAAAPRLVSFVPFDNSDYGGLGSGEVNGDGLLDVVTGRCGVVVEGGATVQPFFGQPDGSFVAGAPNTFFMAVGGPDSMAVADFDRDGKLDVVITGYNSYDDAPVLQRMGLILTGRGDGTFDVATGPSTPMHHNRVTDLNGDRRPDIIVFGSPQTRILLNTSTLAVGESDDRNDRRLLVQELDQLI